jgi:hypothetical protein
MEGKEKGMRSIWYFVGLIMFVIGLVELAAGIYDLYFPTKNDVKLAYLHANIWWGILILIIGLIYIVKQKNKYTNR